jgi:Tol biopolymer transport system component
MPAVFSCTYATADCVPVIAAIYKLCRERSTPAVRNAATQQGVILGTAAYMSPEQARGKAVDKRADIWAFGCVLFEMLTGRQTWTGTTVTDIIAAALAKDPDFGSLPSNINPRIHELLDHCLQKDPMERFRDVGDIRIEIKHILAEPRGVLVQPVTTVEPHKKLRTMLPWLAAAVVLTAVVAGVAVWNLKPTPPAEPRRVTRFPLEADGISGGMALSPDGSRLVYSAVKDGMRQLFLHARDQMEAVSIRDTKNATYPFFSPDGKWVGFFTGSELKKVSLSGGDAQTLCKAGNQRGASWGSDDSIVFASFDSPGLMRVPASGGQPKSLTTPGDDSGLHCWPEYVPGQKAVLFTILKGYGDWQLAVQSPEMKNYRVLIDGTGGRFASSGHLVFARNASLWAVPFDSARLQLKGEAVLIVEGVEIGSFGIANYALANDGSLAYLPGGLGISTSLTWVDRQGKEEPIAAPKNLSYVHPGISPDGRRVALTVNDGSGSFQIWIWDLVRETLTQLTFDKNRSLYPLWTPDGKRVAFFAVRDGKPGVYWKAADGTGKEELLGSPGAGIFPASWSDNGKTLVVMEGVGLGAKNLDIGVLSMEGDRKLKPLLKEKYHEAQPRISPDGKWMAYTSNESGQNQIYVRPFPQVESGGRWQVSTNGGDTPLWSPNGRQLFYLGGDAAMAVSVKTDPSFSLETPKVLFRIRYSPTDLAAPLSLNSWDISPDGKRFLMTNLPWPAEIAGGPRKINIVLNWFEELKQRVPVHVQ